MVETATDYEAFLASKTNYGGFDGFEPIEIPDFLFPFQRHLVGWAIRKGRAAIFAECGLGKTPMLLTWADNVVRHTGGRVLVLTPLSVAGQTVREAHKFGFDAEVSRDGKFSKNIVVTNYEKLHLFDPKDFVGVVCDECFPGDTPIDVVSVIDGNIAIKPTPIKDVRVGDLILNASGIDTVSDVHRREVQYAIRITVDGKQIVSSPNHPYFTQRGWVGAIDLQPGDSIVGTSEAVRLVRGDCGPAIGLTEGQAFLQHVLLSEMADASAGDTGEGSLVGSGCEAWEEAVGVAEVRKAGGYRGVGSNQGLESDLGPRGAGEDLPPIESDEARTFRAWGKRAWDDGASEDPDGCVGRRLGGGVYFVAGPTDSRLSNALQDRLSRSRSEARDRGGWVLALGDRETGAGPEEGSQAGFARVDRLEVLEQGDPSLEQYRGEDGRIYFYDLGATRHPSFSINGRLVHNSSILKSFEGVTKAAVTDFMREKRYRLLCTATAAPNDYFELGTSSEALGEMGFMDMLGMFFKLDQSKTFHRAWARQQKHRLRGHAERDFWRWVCSWARACRKPSDLGFDDGDYVLPGLEMREHAVKARSARPGFLFDMPPRSLQDQQEERRRTIVERSEKVAELVAAHEGHSIVWCHLNPEGDTLERLIPGAVQVSGRTDDAEKERAIEWFVGADGNTQAKRTLISKPSVFGYGLNLQCCHHQTFFPSHSYEEMHQAIRRSYRFGQEHRVIVDMVLTESQQGILASVKSKSDAADAMFGHLVELMNDQLKIDRDNPYILNQEIPSWL